MALTLEQKQQVVAEVSEVAANAYSAVAAEYHGIGVAKLTKLREQAREKGVVLKVVKNTLAKRAFEGTKFESMSDRMTGPLLLAFSMEDLGSAARVVFDFSKDNSALETKLVSVGGVVYGRGRARARIEATNSRRSNLYLDGYYECTSDQACSNYERCS